MGYIIGDYNRKGGVGKSHSTINLGAQFALTGKKVLLVEGDSQLNLSFFFFEENEKLFDGTELLEGVDTLYEVLDEKIDLPIYSAVYKIDYAKKRKFLNKFRQLNFEFDIVPGSRKLDYLESEDLFLLKNKLDTLRHEYDYIIIDFPPAKNDLTLMYMAACDYIIVPAELGKTSSLTGYADVIEGVDTLKSADSNIKLEILGMFYTKAKDYSSEQKKTYDESLEEKDALILFETYIRYSDAATRYSDKTHQPLCVSDYKCNAARDYARLCEEIEKRIQEREK